MTQPGTTVARATMNYNGYTVIKTSFRQILLPQTVLPEDTSISIMLTLFYGNVKAFFADRLHSKKISELVTLHIKSALL